MAETDSKVPYLLNGDPDPDRDVILSVGADAAAKHL